MDLNEVLIFTKVVEAESFTGAARELGLPKSTVSRKVSQLEERLGVRLLQRTTRKLNLTDVGSAYYQRAARIVQEIEEAELAVAQMQSSPRGTLRITVPAEVASAFLGDLIAEYLEANADVSIELTSTPRLVNLVEEGFDLAIRIGQLSDSSLIARKLAPARLHVCASPGYLERHGLPTHPRDLDDHECVLFGDPSFARTWKFRGPQDELSVHVDGRLRTDNFPMIRESLMAGHGIGRLPTHLCREEFRTGQLVEVLADWMLSSSGVYAVYPTSRHLSPKVRTFIDFLYERLSATYDPDSDQRPAAQ
jgi:DNA-binding transcriptional LysR family regulator